MKAFLLMLLVGSYANAALVSNFVIKNEEPEISESGNAYWNDVLSKDNKCRLTRATNKPREWQYLFIGTADTSHHISYQQIGNDLSIYTTNYGQDKCDVIRVNDKVLSVSCSSGLFKKMSFKIFLNAERFIERITFKTRYIADMFYIPTFGSFDCRF